MAIPMDKSSHGGPAGSAEHEAVPSHVFHKLYEKRPPWEIGRPQPEVVRLGAEGVFVGDVLDAGCGTGENAIHLATLDGCRVLGVDIVPVAVDQAREKAQKRGVDVAFLAHDVRQVHQLAQRFDVVLDSGTFHVLSDEDRVAYADAVRQAMRPGGLLILLCFCEAETRDRGPRRVTQKEIRACFAQGWMVEQIEAVRYDVTFYEDGARNWLARLRRI